MNSKQPAIRHKNQAYEVVTVVEERRCPLCEAALVSEAEMTITGEISVPMRPNRKVLHCPFCTSLQLLPLAHSQAAPIG